MRADLKSALAAALIGGSLVVTACGSATKTVTVQRPVGGTATETHSATSSTASSSEPPPRIVHLSAFRSPTGNIGCMIIDALARCDIDKRSWSPPPRPASCPHIVDFGQGIEISHRGAARFVCAGDTARDPNSPELPYGTATQLEGLRCVSRPSGMTCTDEESRHGFTLSIQSYSIF